ncbi:MAG: heavy-metal-associated domain-containing protein [Crocinitomicaceae bacterium]|nr:heavy-metal-associated domain-containing protein [Crocinitomicaceae bacterium]
MKNVLSLAVMAMLVVSCGVSNGADAQKVTAKIMTNAECGMCKDRIEGALNYEKGIVFAELDVPSKVVTVKFKNDVISLEQIRSTISKLGYNADEIKADATAQGNLPACCQPGGMK